jgi:hypothetical protein
MCAGTNFAKMQHRKNTYRDDAAAGVAGANDSKIRAVLDPHRRPLLPQRLPQGGRFRFEQTGDKGLEIEASTINP